MYSFDLSLTTLARMDGSMLPFGCWEKELGKDNAAEMVLGGNFKGLDVLGSNSDSPIIFTTKQTGPFLALCLVGMYLTSA